MDSCFRREAHSHLNDMLNRFSRYQFLAWETLIAFVDVCNRNAIRYQLAFGSLLGAVRHGGQIPWDYDIDVLVPYDDRISLIEALNHDLDDSIYFMCREINHSCRYNIMRLAPKGYDTTALHVDVFFLVGAPEDHKARERHARRLFYATRARYKKLVDAEKESMGSKARYLRLRMDNALYAPVPETLLFRDYSRLCTKYPYDSSPYLMEASLFSKFCMPRRLLEDCDAVEVNGVNLSIPKYYSEILSQWYGDYERVPVLGDRWNEFERGLERLEYFCKE